MCLLYITILRGQLKLSIFKIQYKVIKAAPTQHTRQYGCFESFAFAKRLLYSSARPRDFDGMLGTGLSVSMYTTESQIDMQRVNVPQLKEFLAFSVKDRYQLKKNCIKGFNE